MTQETLELVTELSELKKNYESKLSLLSEPDSKIAISFVPFYKKKNYFDREEYVTFFNDKEIVEIVKEYCRNKIENYQKQIESI